MRAVEAAVSSDPTAHILDLIEAHGHFELTMVPAPEQHAYRAALARLARWGALVTRWTVNPGGPRYQPTFPLEPRPGALERVYEALASAGAAGLSIKAVRRATGLRHQAAKAALTELLLGGLVSMSAEQTGKREAFVYRVTAD